MHRRWGTDTPLAGRPNLGPIRADESDRPDLSINYSLLSVIRSWPSAGLRSGTKLEIPGHRHTLPTEEIMGEVNYAEKEVTTVSQLIPLVQKLACRFRRDSWSAADRDDIRQEGFVGLIEAARRFERSRGCSLRTFGGRRAAGAMMDYVRTLCRKSRERSTEDLPSEECRLRRAQPDYETPGSMESGVMLLRFRQFLAGEDGGLGLLPDDEREVIRLRFFEGLSCRESAEAMKVSPATICRLERRALDKLRQGFVSSCGVSESGCDAYDADEAGEEDAAPSSGFSGIIRMLTI